MSDQFEQRERTALWLLVFSVLLALSIGFILSSELLLTPRVDIHEGQIAEEDVAAPYEIRFDSAIRTVAARKRAVNAVDPVYEPLDRQVGREQIGLARQILSFIDSTRADPYASPAYRQFCLESIESVTLSARAISDTLRLSDPEWQAVRSEVQLVLSQAMSEEIRTGREDEYRHTVHAEISLGLDESQAVIVSEIVTALIRANCAYNPQTTEAARQTALESVPPQVRELEVNEVFIRSGEFVTAEDVEALDALGMRNPKIEWAAVTGTMLFALLLAIATSVCLWHCEPALLNRPHHLLLLLLLFSLFALLAKWELPKSVSQLYLVPLATLSMLVSALFDVRLGLVAHALICLVTAFLSEGRLDLLLYNLAGGLAGILALRQVRRIGAFAWAGGYVTLANVLAIVSLALLDGDLDLPRLGRLILTSGVNGSFSAILTLGGYYVLGMTFNITTALQLLDIARPTHPLMRQLLLKAPGTYHHSILVGNLAEQAAEAIGANTLLARVGAFYHDIGKTARPYFFAENQIGGTNPHDLLDPETSAQIIRSHTGDGLELARKYRLPPAVRAFIAEHHGTDRISYFYHKAVEDHREEHIDVRRYEYAGPRPRSKETAIVMMADGCEAAVRSVQPEDAKSLANLIRRILSAKLASGQLNDAPLTLQEIDVITFSLVDTLRGAFHPRVRYPGEETDTASSHGLLPIAPVERGVPSSC